MLLSWLRRRRPACHMEQVPDAIRPPDRQGGKWVEIASWKR
jgi:hypothetical protein